MVLFSSTDLARMHEDEICQISFKTSETIINLKPSYLNDVQTGVKRNLRARLKRYDRRLGGILLGYDNVKVKLGSARFGDNGAFVQYEATMDCYLFQPVLGRFLQGVVIKISPECIGCMVHKYFHATIVRTSEEDPEYWSDLPINFGDKLTFRVKELDFTSNIPVIEGELPDKYKKKRLHGDKNFLSSTQQPSTSGVDCGPADFEFLSPIPPPPRKRAKKVSVTESPLAASNTPFSPLSSDTSAICDTETQKKKKKKKKDLEAEESFLEVSMNDIDFLTPVPSDQIVTKKRLKTNDSVSNKSATQLCTSSAFDKSAASEDTVIRKKKKDRLVFPSEAEESFLEVSTDDFPSQKNKEHKKKKKKEKRRGLECADSSLPISSGIQIDMVGGLGSGAVSFDSFLASGDDTPKPKKKKKKDKNSPNAELLNSDILKNNALSFESPANRLVEKSPEDVLSETHGLKLSKVKKKKDKNRSKAELSNSDILKDNAISFESPASRLVEKSPEDVLSETHGLKLSKVKKKKDKNRSKAELSNSDILKDNAISFESPASRLVEKSPEDVLSETDWLKLSKAKKKKDKNRSKAELLNSDILKDNALSFESPASRLVEKSPEDVLSETDWLTLSKAKKKKKKKEAGHKTLSIVGLGESENRNSESFILSGDEGSNVKESKMKKKKYLLETPKRKYDDSSTLASESKSKKAKLTPFGPSKKETEMQSNPKVAPVSLVVEPQASKTATDSSKKQLAVSNVSGELLQPISDDSSRDSYESTSSDNDSRSPMGNAYTKISSNKNVVNAGVFGRPKDKIISNMPSTEAEDVSKSRKTSSYEATIMAVAKEAWEDDLNWTESDGFHRKTSATSVNSNSQKKLKTNTVKTSPERKTPLSRFGQLATIEEEPLTGSNYGPTETREKSNEKLGAKKKIKKSLNLVMPNAPSSSSSSHTESRSSGNSDISIPKQNSTSSLDAIIDAVVSGFSEDTEKGLGLEPKVLQKKSKISLNLENSNVSSATCLESKGSINETSISKPMASSSLDAIIAAVVRGSSKDPEKGLGLEPKTPQKKSKISLNLANSKVSTVSYLESTGSINETSIPKPMSSSFAATINAVARGSLEDPEEGLEVPKKEDESSKPTKTKKGGEKSSLMLGSSEVLQRDTASKPTVNKDIKNKINATKKSIKSLSVEKPDVPEAVAVSSNSSLESKSSSNDTPEISIHKSIATSSLEATIAAVVSGFSDDPDEALVMKTTTGKNINVKSSPTKSKAQKIPKKSEKEPSLKQQKLAYTPVTNPVVTSEDPPKEPTPELKIIKENINNVPAPKTPKKKWTKQSKLSFTPISATISAVSHPHEDHEDKVPKEENGEDYDSKPVQKATRAKRVATEDMLASYLETIEAVAGGDGELRSGIVTLGGVVSRSFVFESSSNNKKNEKQTKLTEFYESSSSDKVYLEESKNLEPASGKSPKKKDTEKPGKRVSHGVESMEDSDIFVPKKRQTPKSVKILVNQGDSSSNITSKKRNPPSGKHSKVQSIGHPKEEVREAKSMISEAGPSSSNSDLSKGKDSKSVKRKSSAKGVTSENKLQSPSKTKKPAKTNEVADQLKKLLSSINKFDGDGAERFKNLAAELQNLIK